ncbi:hypothetical protein AHF37_12580 [Paragonimus kellicotti]|nr:hypothetical protein AHF37_12580 [Paragonimus kellicotti]
MLKIRCTLYSPSVLVHTDNKWRCVHKCALLLHNRCTINPTYQPHAMVLAEQHSVQHFVSVCHLPI